MRKEDVLEALEEKYPLLDSPAISLLHSEIDRYLSSTKIMYRLFYRNKTKESLMEKIEKKYEVYEEEGRGIRDLYGLRIILYFQDDIDICINLLKLKYDMVAEKHDRPRADVFAPQRINYIFRLPQHIEIVGKDTLMECLVEDTFEVQIRTIFSEGWHEVDHDIRYKYMDAWKMHGKYERELNGIFAALEVCNQAIINICDSLAYDEYKNGNWESMIRNRFRLRFRHKPLDGRISAVLSEDKGIAKEIYRYDRYKLVGLLQTTSLPCTYDNIVFLINLETVHKKSISDITPSLISKKYEDINNSKRADRL